MEIRATAATVSIHATIVAPSGETLLATHPRAVGRGARIVDETHWDGLPDGHTRAVTTGDTSPPPRRERPANSPLQALLTRAAAAQVTVAARPLSVYDQIAGTGGLTASRTHHLKDVTRD